MEMTKQEIAAVEIAIVEVKKAVIELDQLELSIVGGGHGDISLG
jgi:hypothetical protein